MLNRLGCFVFFAAFAATSAHAMTADELVAKNIAARGGMESLQAIKSLRLEGKLIVDGSASKSPARSSTSGPATIASKARCRA